MLVLAVNAALSILQAGPGKCGLEQVKLRESAPQQGDRFGSSVSLVGDRLAIGNSRDKTKGNFAGGASIFEREGARWVLTQELFASDPHPWDNFGVTIDMDDDVVVVGASGYDHAFPDSGAVYVFHYDGVHWHEAARLLHPMGKAGGRFGSSLSLDGDLLVVGAYDEPISNFGGRAFVYERSGSSWTLAATLEGSDTTVNDRFGWAVAIGGETIAVGAVENQAAAADAGAVYVFERNGSSWAETAKLVPSDIKPDDAFGVCVQFQNEELFAASFDQPDSEGAVYRFRKEQGNWLEKQKLKPENAVVDGRFGKTLDSDTDRLVIGSGLPTGSGRVYLFTPDGSGEWVNRDRLHPRDPTNDSFSALGLSISGDTIASAAPTADQTGAVYTFEIYDKPHCPEIYCTAKTSSCNSRPRISALGISSASNSSGFDVYATKAKAAQSGLIVYSDAGSAAIPFQGGTLCINPQPLRRTVPVTDTVGNAPFCDGFLSMDMNAFAHGILGGNPAPSLLVPGTDVFCQFIARDTVANGSLLSDGLSYTVGP